MGNWLDLINLGVNAAQSYQLGKVSASLSQIQTGAAADAQRKQVLEVVRNFVFELAQDIRALDDHVDTSPQQVYVVARALNWRLQDSGITPEIFPEFADKEYVVQTQTKIRENTQLAQQRLSGEELEAAEDAFTYIMQADLLSRAIVAKEAQEEIQSTESAWQEVSKEEESDSGNKTKGCIGIAATLILFPIAMTLCSSSENPGNVFLGIVGGILTCVLAYYSISWVSQKKSSSYKDLKTKREELRKKLVPVDVWKQVVDIWGDLPSKDYRAIQAERNQHLREIFDQVEGFNRFLPS